jgi:hypothetical protein
MSWISDEYQKLDQSRPALRRFGFSVGGVMLSLGILLLWRHRQGSGWPLTSIGSTLVVAAALAPASLKYVHGTWMILSLAVGWVVTRVLLTIVFFLIVSPIGLAQRAFGKRAIEAAFKTDATSYWQRRPGLPEPVDYEKQF